MGTGPGMDTGVEYWLRFGVWVRVVVMVTELGIGKGNGYGYRCLVWLQNTYRSVRSGCGTGTGVGYGYMCDVWVKWLSMGSGVGYR